jgi:parvulin-like peptidyl-prolyl isomerase
MSNLPKGGLMSVKILSLVLLLPLLAACSPDNGEAPAPPPAAELAVLEEPDWSSVVAKVNGEPITRRLLSNQVALAAANQPPEETETGTPKERTALETEELRNLIILELAGQEALRRGYAPAEEELNEALALYNNDFDEPEQLYGVLDPYGSTSENLTKQLARNMALQKWQADEFLAETTVDEAEALAFYQARLDQLRHDEMLHLSQILVGVPSPAAKAQARAKAEEAFRRLDAGEDFNSVAAEINAGSTENPGDLGWLTRGQTLPAIEAAAWDLSPGAHSGVVETSLGFHIVKVIDRRPPGVESFDRLKPGLIEFISARKLEEALNRKMRELTRAADIEIFDPALSGARPEAGEDREIKPTP